MLGAEYVRVPLFHGLFFAGVVAGFFLVTDDAGAAAVLTAVLLAGAALVGLAGFRRATRRFDECVPP